MAMCPGPAPLRQLVPPSVASEIDYLTIFGRGSLVGRAVFGKNHDIFFKMVKFKNETISPINYF